MGSSSRLQILLLLLLLLLFLSGSRRAFAPPVLAEGFGLSQADSAQEATRCLARFLAANLSVSRNREDFQRLIDFSDQVILLERRELRVPSSLLYLVAERIGEYQRFALAIHQNVRAADVENTPTENQKNALNDRNVKILSQALDRARTPQDYAQMVAEAFGNDAARGLTMSLTREQREALFMDERTGTPRFEARFGRPFAEVILAAAGQVPDLATGFEALPDWRLLKLIGTLTPLFEEYVPVANFDQGRLRNIHRALRGLGERLVREGRASGKAYTTDAESQGARLRNIGMSVEGYLVSFCLRLYYWVK